MGGKETERLQMKELETDSLLQLSPSPSTVFPPIDRVATERRPTSTYNAKKQRKTKDPSWKDRPFLPKVKDGFRITTAWAEEKKKHKWKDKVHVSTIDKIVAVEISRF